MKHTHEKSFCLPCSLDKITPLLPHQGPIKDFVHQNTLQVLINLPFEEALNKASKLFNAHSYMDLDFYRSKYQEGEITESALKYSIEQSACIKSTCSSKFLHHALFHLNEIIDEGSFYYLCTSKNFPYGQLLEECQQLNGLFQEQKSDTGMIRKTITKTVGSSLEHEVNRILFRLLGAYLDQGMCLWGFPMDTSSFSDAVRLIASKSILPIADFVCNDEIASLLSSPLEQLVPNTLSKLISSEELFEGYLQESLFAHPGWSGMVNVIAHHPESLAKPRKIQMGEIIAVKIILEWQYIKAKCPKYKPIGIKEVLAEKAFCAKQICREAMSLVYWKHGLPSDWQELGKNELYNFRPVLLQKLWQSALEYSYYQSIATKFSSFVQRTKKTQKIKFQAVFCIDDRECSFRRILEEVSCQIETFGFPGFFGVDCYFKPHKKDMLEKMCPPSASPQHIVMEKEFEQVSKPGLLEFASFISRHEANSMLFGFISAYTLGHLSLFRLLLSFFHPFKLAHSISINKANQKTSLIFESREPREMQNNFYIGYSHQEMADRVYTTLKNMGLTKEFSSLVFIIGHGSSSVNNPHFAAYDCGACSGRPGAMNAQVFAAMANMPTVRQLVKCKGICIPDDTFFVGGYHDTCTDEVRLFDLEKLPQEKSSLLDEFQQCIKEVQGRNAQERCQKFGLTSKKISKKEALLEVQHRARSLFEPRPELGHASNALCVVGRREKTLGLDFDRRAFLQSYDPYSDHDGQILAELMAAVIPVCGGINLEYFFSRVDPAIYGCGTKLSHNVCSLIGVGNGLDDDLRTGLPIQMTELHDPIRLLIIIEQHPDIIARATLNNTAVAPWIKNDWVRLASLDPRDASLKFLLAKNQHFETIIL